MPNPESIPPVYVVSGGVGASGSQIVGSILAQFPDAGVPLETVSQVREPEQLPPIIERVAASGGIIVHTLVDARMREDLFRLAAAANVTAIDLMGDLMGWVSRVTGAVPVGRPGLYRELKRDYFDRVAAIDFTVLQDDGKNPAGWKDAEIVLVGVSRAGKTPLSMYLAVQGWRVANIPYVPGIPLPAEIEQVDKRRILALDIDPSRLSIHRTHRQRSLGVAGPMAYSDEASIWTEVDTTRQDLRRRGYTRIDVTDKPMETLAEEVIGTVTRKLGDAATRP